jgi:tetratricopeptide (TPR) repeat protein
MAFGFGFNKQKTLSAAEKYVQQGKMQNAIAEYNKVLKADPKDLTVTNTVGDLYSRLGEVDKATECFKTVGDAYANQGFTVKAIAMYKKISKLKPSLESVLKLAELYTQQGLFNDARSQYLLVAEEFLKANELDHAVRIFQKILEMDPENVNMRLRLAEVYLRLNKKTDAWQIFSAAAETLRSKGSLTGAEEVLQRMLTLDPGNSYALLMQGRNLLEAGDAEAAIASLQKVSDLDSNPDGLRDLLKAYLKTGRLSDAGTLASKLLTVHNDLASISTFADALMQAGQYENALQVYDQHADRLLAEDSAKVLKNLHSVIGYVRENPASLEKLLDLFHKAGETTHITEVIELLAHASVQSGDLIRAKDLYQKLTTMEPGNPLHMNNYQQVVSQMGGEAAASQITPEEAAVIVDELEATSPSVHQHYSDAVALSIRSALTDAELFISYNMPAKALGPLLAALPQAPTDLRLNQRLAALHTRASRFAEAGVCCRTLQNVYSDAGYPEEATRYGELAARYEERSTAAAVAVPVVEPPAAAVDASAEASAAPWPVAPLQPTEEAEFAIVNDSAEDQDSVPHHAEPSHARTIHAQTIQADAEAKAHAQPMGARAGAESEIVPEEIDLSSEWDDAIEIDADALPADLSEITGAVADHDIAATVAQAKAGPARVDPEKTAETIEEIRFYLEHGMPEQAAAAFEKLQTVTDDRSTIELIRAEIAAGSVQSAAVDEVSTVEDISAFSADETSAIEGAAIDEPEVVEPAPVEPALVEAAPAEPNFVEAPAAEAPKEIVLEQVAETAPEAPPVVEATALPEAPAAETPTWPMPEPVVAGAIDSELVVTEAAVAGHADEPAPAGPVPAELSEVQPAVSDTAAPAPNVLQEFVSDLESCLGDNFIPTVLKEPEPAVEAASSQAAAESVAETRLELEPIGKAAPTHFGVPQTQLEAESENKPMGEFVAELEASLGDDFLKGAPVAEVQATPEAQAVTQVEAPVASAPEPAWPSLAATPPAPVSAAVAPIAAAAAASSGSSAISASASPTPVAPTLPILPTMASAPAAQASPFAEEARVDLTEMFGELKQDLEEGSATIEEDPETHYNLGIAFREMGLLDEAIGELQKTCQSIDHGHPFPQTMQTFTWLAQCFLDKGVPQAAIRWYDRALNVGGIDEQTRTALHYELAAAYEASGDRSSALKHFMEVYGRNIDYRDVAERIKPLKS